MLKLKHFREDFSATLLDPIKTNSVADLIIYLDIFHKRNKLQYLEAATDPRLSSVMQVQYTSWKDR